MHKLNEVPVDFDYRFFHINNYHNFISTIANNRNNYPTKELAEAGLALTQLLYLRDIYNDGWVADWNDDANNKFCISIVANELRRTTLDYTNKTMHFKSAELRDTFLHNFKDLLETAKPLL